MKKTFLSMVAAIGLVGFAGQATAGCGSISMADMNWPSATLMANVDKVILEEGYGCEIEMVGENYFSKLLKKRGCNDDDICVYERKRAARCCSRALDKRSP